MPIISSSPSATASPSTGAPGCWPTISATRRGPGAFYLSFVNFSFWGEDIDVLGNLLAALAGVADSSRAVQIAEGVKALGVDAPWPVRVVGRPIGEDSPLWRRYMQRHRQNYPFQYHNGGCWPFAGGFWVMLLARLGWRTQGWENLERLAAANRLGDWEFNEWFHGKSGKPLGMPGQSWNAALYILAYRALADGTRFFELCPPPARGRMVFDCGRIGSGRIRPIGSDPSDPTRPGSETLSEVREETCPPP